MRLKRIEIHGFKSFAEKTDFELGRGVTCLVGPNGCGKSNVVDAVKWALGEQRPTALRGDQMADVIFKGNGSRPAMGFAEVTLVFDNESSDLAIDTSEVAISRRLYRNGDSEYLINRHSCRLKDVRELFLDTGLGQNAYAVLEQGRIDAVLNANPVDRRAIFEEAAGIQRFRTRKREAARRLEKVDQNLLRIADLIEELEKRVRSLRIQAGRARSYVALSDRLTELKTIRFLSAGAEMAVRAEELEAALDGARQNDGKSEQELADATQGVEQADAERQLLRESVSRQRNRKVEIRADFNNSVTRSGALKERENEARQELKDRQSQLEKLQTERLQREDEARRLSMDLEVLGAELVQAEKLAGECRTAVQSARGTAADRDSRLVRLESEILHLTDEELALSNRLASLESHARGLRVSRERLIRREAELAGLLEKLRLDGLGVREHISRLDEEARDQTLSIASAKEQLQARQEREVGVRGQIGSIRADMAARGSRRDTLDAVIEKMEGIDEGTRALVQAVRQDPTRLPGVLGLLAEILPVPRERARAVDAALGHLAGAVVVENRESLEAGISFLREESRGPATFLVLDSASLPAGDRDDGAPGESLLSGVDIPHELGLLIEAVLGPVRLVESDVEMLSELGTGRFLVTPEGARLETSGAFTDRPQSRTLGFVERKVERDQLNREVLELRKECTRLEEEEARLAVEVTEWTAIVAEAEQRKREVDAGLQESRSNEERLHDRAAIFRRELSVSSRERLELESEEKSVAGQRTAAEDGLHERRTDRDRIEQERRELSVEKDNAAAVLDQLAMQEATSSKEAVRLGERVRSVQTESAMMARSIEEQAASIARIEEECSVLQNRAVEASEGSAELERSIQDLQGQEVEVRERLDDLVAREAEAETAAKTSRAVAMQAAAQREEARESLHQVELEERELQLNQSSLRERALEEISLDIDEQLAEFDAAGSAPSEEVGRELSVVRDKISRIGNVNLDAIHELEEVEKRLEFLSREKTDLDQSRKSLEQTIAELDAVSRERFKETFDAVREHFKSLFRKLFHGGKADVFLQEGVDVLDAGIEIMAGPPGKDPRSITLLSGGERTMTAVGLLFALFMAKPSPVAILDEVDAALDEANIERFCSLLSEFIGYSQFIIVTHSKRTMSYADVIFGVTMEENGVSKRIGIRLEEYEERVA